VGGGFGGSMQPPWSMATSTTTAPFFMREIICRVTILGAEAPGMSTPPMRRSAFCTARATL